jgi:hypothetical protein
MRISAPRHSRFRLYSGKKRYEDMPTDAAIVAKTLRELAQRMELEGGNPYRARAYAPAPPKTCP